MRKIGILILIMLPFSLWAQELTVTVHQLNDDKSTKGIGQEIGSVTLKDSDYGLVIEPHLKDLSPGLHGFHIHQNASCEGQEKEGKFVPGLAAGGHFDPNSTDKHLGPFSDRGHLGDLPALFCSKEKTCSRTTIAPRLKLEDLKGRSVMIHAKGDNYSDDPEPLGGGGGRVACGVVQ